ncbi:hypothetical protein KKA33_03795 [Patescibacteria group bacterium]|nr:hypothetical protein [Patescibacteria group bacterium]
MEKSDHQSRLTHYKAYHNCQYFGEALLSAASAGFLGCDHIDDTSAQEVLWQLGIGLRMTRDQIIVCLLRLDDQRRIPLSYLDNGNVRSTLIQVRRIVDSAICYTEQDVPEGHSMKTAEAFA